MPVSTRRQILRESLVDAAEAAIETKGLSALRARDLAADVGCAVGAIYNVFADLDDVILSVNARSLAALERELTHIGAQQAAAPASAGAHLARLAGAYLDFALAHTRLWRAIFDHRMPAGRAVPQWYLDRQMRLFAHVEAPLRALRPDLAPSDLAMLARSIVSAIHGVVSLGLEEKLQAISIVALREQLATIVGALVRGLSARKEP